MSVLHLFVTDSELDQILQDFAKHRDLRGALQVKGGYDLYDPMQIPSELITRKDIYQGFLFPKSQVLPVPVCKETIMPRFMGWMPVAKGDLAEQDGKRFLLMTTIQAEDRRELPFRPATWLRALKKRLGESTITFGVDGINVVTGRGGPSKDMGYSKGALEIYQQGVLWKQFATGNIEFSPMK